MILYRPVGVRELELIAESGWRVFPPRLEHQPIFYPVLTFEYAEQIARDWNTGDAASGFAGFVTRFEVEDAFASRYPIQRAGGRGIEELWVPAEELEEFCRHLVGSITLEASYYGPELGGEVSQHTNLPTGVRPPPTPPHAVS